MKDILSSNGRISRSKYVIACTITYLVFAVIGMVHKALGLDEKAEASAMDLLLGCLGVFVFAIFIIQLIKRLHDVNRPGHHAWFLLVPCYNLFLLVSLMFEKGNDGSIPFGEPIDTDNKSGLKSRHAPTSNP